jgi:hypothetical protein
MRKINQEDIQKWNSRLSKINLELSLSVKGLSLFKPYESHGFPTGYGKFLLELIPSVHYQFSFSVSEKTLSRFNNILDNFLEQTMQVDLLDKHNYITTFQIKSKRTDFDKFLTTNTHKIQNVTYQQRVYNFFDLDLLKLINFVSCIEDAVNVIQEYYEYEEDGTEICNIKFPVGSIVSLKSDKSADYLIQNVIFSRNIKEITYDIAKMETKANSEIIIFSETQRFLESEIIPNRDNRLNILLN